MSLVPLFTYFRSFPAGILYGVHDFTEFPVATVYSRSQKIPIIEMRMAFVGWSRLLRSRVRRESTEKGDTRARARATEARSPALGKVHSVEGGSVRYSVASFTRRRAGKERTNTPGKDRTMHEREKQRKVAVSLGHRARERLPSENVGQENRIPGRNRATQHHHASMVHC